MEGVIKYSGRWRQGPAPCHAQLGELQRVREQLWCRGWLGVDLGGIGYGNVSLRAAAPGEFVISGTQTSGERHLAAEGFTRVLRAEPASGQLDVEGPCRASSESLSHAALYESCPAAGAVLHIHSAPLWMHALATRASTSKQAEYGTPALALAVSQVMRELAAPLSGVIALAGHQDGLLSWGCAPEAALDALLRLHAELEPA